MRMLLDEGGWGLLWLLAFTGTSEAVAPHAESPFPLVGTVLTALLLLYVIVSNHRRAAEREAQRLEHEAEREEERQRHAEEMELLEARVRQETPAALVARMDVMDRDRSQFARRAADLENRLREAENAFSRMDAKVREAGVRATEATEVAQLVERRIEERLRELIEERLRAIETCDRNIQSQLEAMAVALGRLACSPSLSSDGVIAGSCPVCKRPIKSE